MRMNCDKPSYLYKPYEVLRRSRDIFGKWGNWRLHSAHRSWEDRSEAMRGLHASDHTEYREHLNLAEYDAMEKALKHQRNNTIAGYAPADGREL